MIALVGWIRVRLQRPERVVRAGRVAFVNGGETWRSVTPVERPDLFPDLVEVCRGCGCTDTDACEGGCWWVARGLCSSCWRSYGGTD